MNISKTDKDITKNEKTPFYSILKSLLKEHIFEMTYISGQLHFKILFKDMQGSKMPATHGSCYQSVRTCKVSQLLYEKLQHNAKLKTQSVGPKRQHFKPEMSFSLPLYWKFWGLSHSKLLQVARETWLKWIRKSLS